MHMSMHARRIQMIPHVKRGRFMGTCWRGDGIFSQIRRFPLKQTKAMREKNKDDPRGMKLRKPAGKEPGVDVPSRRRLYSLAPISRGTLREESLTSYINRLAWGYRIGPRVLIAQEIIPNLTGSYHFQSSFVLLGAFCRSEAMSMNGSGATALDWASTLERLTMRAKLRDLTLCSSA